MAGAYSMLLTRLHVQLYIQASELISWAYLVISIPVCLHIIALMGANGLL